MTMSQNEILNDLKHKPEHRKRRYWIGCVSESHVKHGVEQGIGQTCHGKATKLRQMSEGDYLIYYSPRTDMLDGEPLQAFTALGRVADNSVYLFRKRDVCSLSPQDPIRFLPKRKHQSASP